MHTDGHRRVISSVTAQPGPLLRPADIQARALQDLFDAQGVGVPVEHALRMQTVARQTNTVFGIRPVKRIITTLIEEGFPAKDFSVKGKSSNWGPQTGFICVDQHLSKRENHDTAEIRGPNLAVARGMDGGAYTQTDLRISQRRLAELVRNFGLVTDGVGPIRLLTAQGPSGKHCKFKTRQEPGGLYRIGHLGRSEAMQVLASSACGLAMTANYGLSLVAPLIETRGNSDPDVGRNAAVRYAPLGAKDLLSGNGPYGREDMARGNTTPHTRQLADTLNDCLSRGEYKEMFHHNGSADSPGSHMGDNSPATFYLPRTMERRLGEESVRFGEVYVVTGRRGFSLLVKCVKGSSYHFTAHSDWNVPLWPSFQEALDFSNAGSDVRGSLAKPAFPGGMGILPPVQGLPLAGVCWTARGSQGWILHWQAEADIGGSSTV